MRHLYCASVAAPLSCAVEKGNPVLSELLAAGLVQFSCPRGVSENPFTKPGFWEHFVDFSPWKNSKTQSSLNFPLFEPWKFTKSDFRGLAPIRLLQVSFFVARCLSFLLLFRLCCMGLCPFPPLMRTAQPFREASASAPSERQGIGSETPNRVPKLLVHQNCDALLTLSLLISEDFWVFLSLLSDGSVFNTIRQMCWKYCDRWGKSRKSQK